jgi:Xaa-Pro aminopeptidase
MDAGYRIHSAGIYGEYKHDATSRRKENRRSHASGGAGEIKLECDRRSIEGATMTEAHRSTAAEGDTAPVPGGRQSRLEELSTKLHRVRTWLDGSGYGAALFTGQAGVAWVTAGLEDRVSRNEEPGLVWALVDASGLHLITTNVEGKRLSAEEELAWLGVDLQVTPWDRPGGLDGVASDLTGRARLASDGHGPGTPVPDALAALRLPLTPQEADRLAALGPECAEALEGALRDWRPAERECELAARIAAALEERRLLASLILVGGARRRRAFRHPIPTDAVTGQDALAIIVGVRGGLNVSCSRTVCAGSPQADLEARHRAACTVEAAMITATRPGRSWESVIDVAKAAYEEAGFPGEWRAHFQGGPVGYLSREFDVVPGTPSAATLITLDAGFAWNPTVQGGKSEDTFIVAERGARSVSNTDDWPSLTVETELGPLRRPAILQL